jgi:hypothetical protein
VTTTLVVESIGIVVLVVTTALVFRMRAPESHHRRKVLQ